MASSATIRSLQRQHPLQRLSSPSRGFSALVHSLGLASFFFSFKYMHENPNRANEAYGWHFQYLTVIGLTLATLTFTAGLLADMTLSARLFLAKNLLSIDKRLVVPDWVILPMHADIGFHAVPSIVLLIDLLLLSPPWTITVLPALALSSTIAFGYWFWIERCFQFNGWYPYPVFDAVGFEGRVGLFALSAVVMALSTGTLKWLYGRVNGYGTSAKAQSRPGAIKSNGSI
ncbi:UPF0641 membrane protein PJ4664.05 [Aspergillus awamori]|uniref:UPF0641 membrane protein PJ4664.05 n=1 Tax=Aspergillus awamori TaxID=105351 RepID=A0A401L557_ASPAW|nr:UPF0641 membrane protein PJ4664.05 [Aspergillus awamori]